MRVGSVSTRVIDVHVYGIDLLSVIFRSAFAHDTEIPPLASWYGAISYDLRSDLVFQQSKVSSTHHVAQVNPVLLPFFDRKVMCFFSRTTHAHIRQLRHNVLFVVYKNCPGQQDSQISRQLNTYGTWWSGNLLFLQSLPQALPHCDNGCKMLGTIYLRMTFGTFMAVWIQEYMSALPPESYTVYWCDCLSNPYCYMYVSFDLNLLSYTSTMIDYNSLQFSMQWTSWRCSIFPVV